MCQLKTVNIYGHLFTALKIYARIFDAAKILKTPLSLLVFNVHAQLGGMCVSHRGT